MAIPRNITADFSEDSGPGFIAQYSGKCMTEDLCELGDISPGDWVKYNPDEEVGGLIHTICLARDNGGLVCSRESRRRTGYSNERAANKPTKFQGHSQEEMGY